MPLWTSICQTFFKADKFKLASGIFLCAMGLMVLILTLQVWSLPVDTESLSAPVVKFYRTWRLVASYLFMAFKCLFMTVTLIYINARLEGQESTSPRLPRILFFLGFILFTVPFTDLLYGRWIEATKDSQSLILKEFFHGLLISSQILCEALLAYSLVKGKDTEKKIRSAWQFIVFLVVFAIIGSGVQWFSSMWAKDKYELILTVYVICGLLVQGVVTLCFALMVRFNFNRTRIYDLIYRWGLALVAFNAIFGAVGALSYLAKGWLRFSNVFSGNMAYSIYLLAQLLMVKLFTGGSMQDHVKAAKVVLLLAVTTLFIGLTSDLLLFWNTTIILPSILLTILNNGLGVIYGLGVYLGFSLEDRKPSPLDFTEALREPFLDL